MIRSQSRLFSLLFGGAALVGLAAQAGAQDVDAMRRRFLLAIPEAQRAAVPGGIFRGSPGTNFATPLAFGPVWRDAFVGAGYQSEIRGIYNPVTKTVSANGDDDGAISAGFGLGNAYDAIGLEVVITSLSTVRSGFGERTAFSFKAHHQIDNTSAIALGVENAFIAGGGTTDGADSWYAVASKIFLLPTSNDMGFFKALTVSGGLGNGRFRFIEDVAADKSTVNVFGSVALLVHDQVSAIVDYTGQDLNLAASFVPLKQFPLVITPAIADVTQTASKSARFVLGVGIGMKFQ